MNWFITLREHAHSGVRKSVVLSVSLSISLSVSLSVINQGISLKMVI